jgi:hypothetical protein
MSQSDFLACFGDYDSSRDLELISEEIGYIRAKKKQEEAKGKHK